MGLKVGEKGLLRPDLTPSMANRTVGWVEGMSRLIGKIVTIREIKSNDGYGTVCHLEEDRSSTVYKLDWIIPVQDKEELERYLAEQHKSLEENIKQYCIIPQRVKEIANSVFGEDRVDAVVENANISQLEYDILIHFPIIEMTNSAEAYHKIKDLFVKIYVRGIYPDSELKTHIEFLGTRTSLSLKEDMVAYMHSHLNIDRGTSWCPFCMGNTSFRQIINNIRLNPSEENWELFFRSLPNYLSWESLEGGPYIRISNIVYPNRSVSTSELETELLRVIPSLPTEVWEVNSEGITLIDNHPVLDDFFNEHFSIRESSIDTIKDIPGELKKAQKKRTDSIVTFKGKKVPFIIYVEEEQEKQTSRKALQPSILSWIKNSLKEKSKNFTKRYEYVQRKKHLQNIFEKIGTFESPDCSSDRQARKPDKVSA